MPDGESTFAGPTTDVQYVDEDMYPHLVSFPSTDIVPC